MAGGAAGASPQFQAAPTSSPSPSGTSSSAGRRIGQVGNRPDHAHVERGRGIARASERRGEARPFVAIIVAVAEQVLGELHPRPGAQPRAGDDGDQGRARPGDEGGLQHARIVAAERREGARRDDHRGQINGDPDDGETAERGDARGAERPVAVAVHGDAENQREQRHDNPTRDDEPTRRAAGEPGGGIDPQVQTPHGGQRGKCESKSAACPRCGMDALYQHQRCDRRQHAKRHANAGQQRHDMGMRPDCGLDHRDGRKRRPRRSATAP